MNDIQLGVYKQAIQIMFSPRAPSEGVHELGTIVRNLVPHPIWDKLHRLQFDGEFPNITDWVQTTISAYKQSAPILFFSLSDMGDALSLVFLHKQREPKGDRDWGAYDSSAFDIVPSKVLKKMNRLAETDLANGAGGYTSHDVRWIIETCYPLVYAGLTVRGILQLLPSEILLGVDRERRVAVFFAEGDDFFFGQITKSGFRQYDAPKFALA